MNVKEKLENAIEIRLDELNGLDCKSPEYKTSVDALAKLLEEHSKIEQHDYDYWEKREAREKDTELKLKQMEDDRKDRLIKNILTATSIIGGGALTVWGTFKTFEFEKEGSITTILGRLFVNKLGPKK